MENITQTCLRLWKIKVVFKWKLLPSWLVFILLEICYGRKTHQQSSLAVTFELKQWPAEKDIPNSIIVAWLLYRSPKAFWLDLRLHATEENQCLRDHRFPCWTYSIIQLSGYSIKLPSKFMNPYFLNNAAPSFTREVSWCSGQWLSQRISQVIKGDKTSVSDSNVQQRMRSWITTLVKEHRPSWTQGDQHSLTKSLYGHYRTTVLMKVQNLWWLAENQVS